MNRPPRSKPLLDLKSEHKRLKTEIRRRLLDFSSVPPSRYFYELVYCVLTPQSSAVNADKVISILKEKKFESGNIDPEPVLRRKDCYIRFHRNKSKYLLALKDQFPSVMEKITEGLSGEELRLFLLKHVKGLGWKESSHFLRNIGYTDLAILDRHILRNLLRLGIITEAPRSLTPGIYLQIEKKFRNFANRIGIPIDELDLLFWCMETGQILK